MENQINTRRYDIDWLRILLIGSVFFYHIGMIFNGWNWHIKNQITLEWLHPFMAFLHLWRMPLLFLISGAGTFFALGKRSPGLYLKERQQRLLLPLIFGVFVIVPPQVYIEKIATYQSFPDFYLHVFDGIYPAGNFSWHHLWFIAYLFCFSVLAMPIIVFLRSEGGRKMMLSMEKVLAKPGAFLLLLVPLLLSELLLRPYFPRETHALVDDWAYFTYNFIFFIYGYLFMAGTGISQQLLRQRRIHLCLTVFGIIVYVLFQSGNAAEWPVWLFDFIKHLLAWVLPLSALGYGRKYLSVKNRWLPEVNQAIYPFYILHQTVIVVVAYWILPLPFGIGLKSLFIILVSLLLIGVIYYYLVRPYNLIRICFGLKPEGLKNKISTKETKVPSVLNSMSTKISN